MLACHTCCTRALIVVQLSSPAFTSLSFPLLSKTFPLYPPSKQQHQHRSIGNHLTATAFATLNHRPYVNFIPTTSHTMDSMPHMHRLLHLPNVDVLKVSDPETKAQHLEYIAPTHEIRHSEHLPSGISETDDEKKSQWFIGSIDCGTTSSRFLIFNGDGNPVASHQIEFENIYPESGYVFRVTIPRDLSADLISQMARA